MGKVFTSAEIRNGLPAPGAHLLAAEFLVDQLFFHQNAFRTRPDEYIESGIRSGLVHGSTINGTANIRSDLDIVVLYFPNYPDTLSTIHEVFSETERKYKVPIEANVITVEDAVSGNHSIDPLFLRSLLEAQAYSKFSWQWPADALELGLKSRGYTELERGHVVRRYLGAKSNSFSKALVLDHQMDIHRFQRALELPASLGRKVLSMCDESFSPYSTGKAQVVQGLLGFIAEQEESEARQDKLKRTLQSILDKDSAYSDILEEVTEGEASIVMYDRWINESQRPVVHDALRVCQWVGDTIRGYIRDLTPGEKFDPSSVLPNDDYYYETGSG